MAPSFTVGTWAEGEEEEEEEAVEERAGSGEERPMERRAFLASCPVSFSR
jgi:hypothetical protein